MSETPIFDHLASLADSARKAGEISGREWMRRETMSILKSLPKTKGIEQAIARIAKLDIRKEGQAE